MFGFELWEIALFVTAGSTLVIAIVCLFIDRFLSVLHNKRIHESREQAADLKEAIFQLNLELGCIRVELEQINQNTSPPSSDYD